MKVVLVLSGGMDSAVLLAHLLARGDEVRTLSVDYGQRHRRELACAKSLSVWYQVEHQLADLSGLRALLGGSSQTDATVPVPHGHYTAETMRATVVPNRNMILLAVAGAWAMSTGSQAVAYAAHAGDHAIYPDCRPVFVEACAHALALANDCEMAIERPFVTWTKADICRRGADLGVPFAQTYSCYEGAARHCGRCGTCVERREAFMLAGVPDPTDYATDSELAPTH
jgi:7-cyano-7-deazaguanine synthase